MPEEWNQRQLAVETIAEVHLLAGRQSTLPVRQADHNGVPAEAEVGVVGIEGEFGKHVTLAVGNVVAEGDDSDNEVDAVVVEAEVDLSVVAEVSVGRMEGN